MKNDFDANQDSLACLPFQVNQRYFLQSGWWFSPKQYLSDFHNNQRSSSEIRDGTHFRRNPDWYKYGTASIWDCTQPPVLRLQSEYPGFFPKIHTLCWRGNRWRSTTEMAYLLGFPYIQSFTRDINTTHSTWIVCGNINNFLLKKMKANIPKDAGTKLITLIIVNWLNPLFGQSPFWIHHVTVSPL